MARLAVANHFPLHVVTAWLGNTPRVADKYYLQVTEDHHRQAVSNQNGGATVGAKVVQEPVPQAVAANCTGSQESSQNALSQLLTRIGAIGCDELQLREAPPVGLEPTTRRLTAACSTN